MSNDLAVAGAHGPLAWLRGLIVAAWLGASWAGAQDLQEVRDGIRLRAQALDRVKVEFDWDWYHADIKSDPMDRKSWYQRFPCQCRIWIVRPDFSWYMRGGWPFEGGVTTSWIDGKMTKVSFDADGLRSVLIDSDKFESHGPLPVLTPFELQFCDIQESLLDVVDHGYLEVKSPAPDRITLSGRPRWQGSPSIWSVRIDLDPTRGWLPLELHAEVPRNDGTNKKIAWTMRTLRSRPVRRGVHAIEEAVFAMSNGVTDVWQLYHFTAQSIVVDDTLTKADLAAEIPRDNLRLLDRTTGLVLHTNADGEVIHRRVKTPQEVRDDRLAIDAAFVAADDARAELARRKRVFAGIIAAGGVVTASATGVWVWRRRRALRAA